MTGKTTDQIAAELAPDALAAIVRLLLDDPPDAQRVEDQVERAYPQSPPADTPAPKVTDCETQAVAETTRAHQLYGLFKFFTQDERGRARWQRLRADVQALDRDLAVLNLWKILEKRHHQEIERRWISLSYHRTWLFDWYLGRYDVRYARRAVGGGRWLGNLHLVLLALVVGLFLSRRFPAPPEVPSWTSEAWFTALAVGLLYLLGVGFAAASFRGNVTGPLEAALLALQSLVPRLAAAGVVGLVILGSSEELLDLVVQIPWPWLILPLLGGYVYLLLEMARRIHPLPALGRLARHGFDLWATALCHAMALTLVAERGLRKILDASAPGPFEWQAAVSVAVFVFIIGLVVNLVWAENPVTEPL